MPDERSATSIGTGYDSESYASYLPEKSIYESDERIFHRAGFVYAKVESLRDGQVENGIFRATAVLSDGDTAVFTLRGWREGTLRLQLGRADADFDETSVMLVDDGSASPTLEATFWSADRLTLAFEGYALCIGLEPFSLTIRNPEGHDVFSLETETIAGESIAPALGFRKNQRGGAEPFLSWRIRNQDRHYGLGEKWNKVEKTSTRATIWAADTCGSNTCDLSYKSLPLIYSTAGWGLMLHSGYRSCWEIGSWHYISGSCLTEDPRLDAFLFLKPTLKELVGAYTGLTGRPQMPPKWALGIWQSRTMFENQGEVEETIQRLKEERIPADVINLDPLWMRTHHYYKIGVDACDFERNETAFPDLPSLWKRWQEAGFATCLWVNPYLPETKPIYTEAKEKGYLLKSTEGGLARLSHGEPVGMVDFTNPEAKEWWKGYLKRQLSDGARVFKPDYGDRVPEDALFHNGRTGKEMHNLFLFLFSEACYEASEEVHGKGFVWRRAGYIGSQRYPGTWSGDVQVHWEGFRCTLRGGLSAGFSGEALWSCDIGGFCGPKPDNELYIRWMQFGLFNSLSRYHGTTPREPWHYSEEAVEICRRYTLLRYELMPYLLSCVEEATRTGIPLMRHMALEFQGEPGMDHLDDQYMLGPDILVAPVLNPGQRERTIYFPNGTWWPLDGEGDALPGGRYHTVAAPLERLPLYVREGAVLARYIEAPQHLKGPSPHDYVLEIYPGVRDRNFDVPQEDLPLRVLYRHDGKIGQLLVRPVDAQITLRLVEFEAVPDDSVAWDVSSTASEVTLDAKEGIAFEMNTTTTD